MSTFSQINAPVPLSGIDGSAASAKAYLKDTIHQHIDLHHRSSDWWMLRRPDLEIERAIVGANSGRPENGLASNANLRQLIGYAAIDLFALMQDQHPERRFFLVTLISVVAP